MKAPAILAALAVGLSATLAPAEPVRTLHDTPTRSFDIVHRDLHVRFDLAHHRIEGRMTLSGEALDSTSVLTLDARELEVKSVTDSLGGPLAFDHGETRLVVRFARALERGEHAAVTIEYKAAPRAGLYWITPDREHPGRRAEVWSQNEDRSARFWFPDVDEPLERAASDLWYTVPASMQALGNGRLVETLADPRRGEKTWHWRLEFPHPSYLVTAAVGTFAKVDTTWRGIPVEYFVPPGTEERVARSLGRTPEMMEFFSRRLGVPYPYGRYAQVVVQDFTYGGMENITATTMTERILLDRTAALERTMEGLVAHELAHQWFGDYITCREWAHAWLNEGFATYLSDLWWEYSAGRDEMDRSLLDERASVFGNETERGRRPVMERNWRFAHDLFDAGIYQRGAWVLHMLRRRLGDDAFFRGLQHYLESCGGKSVDTDAFRLAMEEATGAGLDGFFDQWVAHAGVPELKVSWEWLEARKLAHLTVDQTQPSDSLTPLFRFDLPVRFALGSGEVRDVVAVDSRHHEAWVALPSRPRYVEVDDDLSVLCRLAFDRPASELAAQLADAPLAAGRIEAARALGEMGGKPAALAALARAVREDRFYAVRRAAAEALGRVPTPGGLEALRPGLSDRDARVRKTAVASLAHFRDVPGAVPAARAALSDPAYGVVACAVGTLAKLGTEDAHGQCLKALERPSWSDTIRTAALDGLAELGEPRSLPPIAQRTRVGEPVAVRIAACRALGKLGARLPAEPAAGKTTRREARLAIEPLLWDEKMRVRQEAASALGALGDPEGLALLTRLMAREPEDAVSAAAIEAQGKLRVKGDRALADLKAEIERLKDRNRALEARLQSLEDAFKIGAPVPRP
jgi:aminopeptidase N